MLLSHWLKALAFCEKRVLRKIGFLIHTHSYLCITDDFWVSCPSPSLSYECGIQVHGKELAMSIDCLLCLGILEIPEYLGSPH